MKRILIIYFCLLCSFGALFSDSPVQKLQSYELLSGCYNEIDKYWHEFSTDDRHDLEQFAAAYYQQVPLLRSPVAKHYRIPKVLHFIWIGPKPFPEDSIRNVESWKKRHPDWIMKFWTDDLDRPCPVEGMEKHLISEIRFFKLKDYLKKTSNYAEKADLLRYEIIYNEGGTYVDHDVKCYLPFDIFHSHFDFYVGLENPHSNKGTKTKVFPCNCLFGARPGHPILGETILEVVKRWKAVEKLYPGEGRSNTFNRVINRTFHAFTLATKRFLQRNNNRDIVLPSSYFFAHTILRPKTIKSFKRKKLIYAAHSFETTWLDASSNSKTLPE